MKPKSGQEFQENQDQEIGNNSILDCSDLPLVDLPVTKDGAIEKNPIHMLLKSPEDTPQSGVGHRLSSSSDRRKLNQLSASRTPVMSPGDLSSIITDQTQTLQNTKRTGMDMSQGNYGLDLIQEIDAADLKNTEKREIYARLTQEINYSALNKS